MAFFSFSAARGGFFSPTWPLVWLRDTSINCSRSHLASFLFFSGTPDYAPLGRRMTAYDLLHLTMTFQWSLIVFLVLALAVSVFGNVTMARILHAEQGGEPVWFERAIRKLFPG